MVLVPNSPIITGIIASWFQDEELGPLMGGFSVSKPLDNIIEYINGVYDGVNNIIVGAYDKEKDVLGGAYLVNINHVAKRAELHHVFLKEYRGKFCLRAYDAMLDYMKNQLRMEILYGMFATSNTHPAKYLTRLGWKKAAVLPKYFITSKGQEDSHVYYLDLA